MDRSAYTKLGQLLTEKHTSHLSTQLSVFQSVLVTFATRYKDEISSNGEFRAKFTAMCSSVGVDPLELLLNSASDRNSFHMGLAVRVVEVCSETRDLNGGLISYRELISILQSDNLAVQLSEDDIDRAVEKLAVLGENAYSRISSGTRKWLKFSSPVNSISNDQRRVYDLCEFTGGYVTFALLGDNFGWDVVRARSVIDEMIMGGLLWVDKGGGEVMYWEPSWSEIRTK